MEHIFKGIIVGLCLVLCLAAFPVFGQETETPAKKDMGELGMGYFMLGYDMPDIGALNSALKTAGYPTFSDKFVTLGGGGHSFIRRFLLGGEGHAMVGEDQSVTLNETEYKVSFNGGYGFFDIGYAVISTPRFHVYPFLGIGGGGYTLRITKNDKPTFDSVMVNPGNNSNLSIGGLMLQFGIGVDYFLPMSEREDGVGGPMIGLRAGFLLTPIKGDWFLEDIEILGGPHLGIKGPYVRLMLGGGGTSRK
jgi:hypothetical protein